MRFVAVLLALILAGCATPYGKRGVLGGYTDARISEDTFSINVQANAATSQHTATLHALYRAAELTVENGFDHFTVIGGSDQTQTGAIAIPGQSTATTTFYGGQATTSTYTAPTIVVPVVRRSSSLVIRAGKGATPAGAHDARSVLKYLGPTVLEK